MKKNTLINSEISFLVSNMRHTDQLVISDAGLPVPKNVDQVDLAVTKGVPDFMAVLKAVLSELNVEKVILAEEIKNKGLQLYNEIIPLLKTIESEEHIHIEIEYVTHEIFKVKTADSKAIIRTGEYTPYANIILISGVVF